MAFTTAEPAFRFRQGTRPLLISMPHVGTHVPPALAARFTDEARHVPDTDWHLEQLYGFADALGASVLVATHSRYVVDLNRPPDGASLYPGQSVTGLCPVDTFDDTPVYANAADVPGDDEIAARRDAIWQPYHQQLQAELDRLKAAHGTIALLGIAESATGYTGVLNGRFKGGHITRQYGNPAGGVHAVQLEMTQSSYMQEALPFDYLPAVAAGVQPHVRRMLEAVLDFVEGRNR